MSFYTSDNPLHIGTMVFLGGVLQSDVIECDTSDGWILRRQRDAKGRIFLDGDKVATEKVLGKVTVKAPT
jgi:hypothetical protein